MTGHELERPVLNPAFVAVSPDEHTVQIRAGPWSGPVMTIQETDHDESVETLFEKLDGERTFEEILEPYDDENRRAIVSLFEQLDEKHILYDAADWNGERGRPQLSVAPRFKSETAQRLDEQSVLVVSVGSLGPQIAMDLHQSGVGTVRLHRPSVPEPDAHDDPTGLVERLSETSGVELIDGELRTLLNDADAAVVATDSDRPSIVSAFNEVAYETGTPWMLAQVRGFDGLVGPVVFPGETACYRCLERRIESNISERGSYAEYRDGIGDDPSMASIGLPSFARTVAGFATVDLLYLLAFGQAFTVGRTLAISFLDLSVEVNEALKTPRCPVCGKTPGDDDRRFVTVDEFLDSEEWTRIRGGN